MPRTNEPAIGHPHIPEYLTVKEAASLLGVSPRTVYGYIEADTLPGLSIGNTTVVLAADVASFQRRAPGRKRVQTPRWHIAMLEGQLLLATLAQRVTFELVPDQSLIIDPVHHLTLRPAGALNVTVRRR